MEKKKAQSITINYQAETPLSMHDVVYFVVPEVSCTFYRKCRVCGGAKELTINSITFSCPCCYHEEVAITVHKYVVRCYRICKIEVESSTDTWKPSDLQHVRFYAYSKHRYGYGCVKLRNVNLDALNPVNLKFIRDPAFTNYARAVEVEKEMNACEQKRLAEYNEQHGTNYEMPAYADIVNDKKSN